MSGAEADFEVSDLDSPTADDQNIASIPASEATAPVEVTVADPTDDMDKEEDVSLTLETLPTEVNWT